MLNFWKEKGNYRHTPTRIILDYIFINKKWNESALNFKAYSSFESVSSDHKIVMAKIRLSLWTNAARTINTIHYDWSLLNNRDIRDEYMSTLRNKFDVLQEISETPTPNENMRISSMPTYKKQQNAYRLNKELKLESHGRH